MGPLDRILYAELPPVNVPEIAWQSRALVFADNVCDYIPIISSISNAVDLYVRPSRYEDLTLDPITNYTYYKWHLQEKSTLRCVILMLLPGIGNFIFLVYDCMNRKYDNEAFVLNELQRPEKDEIIKKVSLRLRSFPNIVLAAITTLPEDTSGRMHRVLVSNTYKVESLPFWRIEELDFASPLLRVSLAFLRLACQANGEVLRFATLECRKDLVAAVHAVNHSPSVYSAVHISLRQGESEEVLALAESALRVAANIRSTPSLVWNNREKVLDAVKRNPNVLKEFPRYQNDADFLKVASEKKPANM